MKTAIKQCLARVPASVSRMVPGVLAGVLLASPGMSAGAEDSFQQNALFNPSRAQLKAEADGRVMIYDGLENEVVERAMDEQFERIEHMMFIHIRRTQPDGEASVKDDDC